MSLRSFTEIETKTISASTTSASVTFTTSIDVCTDWLISNAGSAAVSLKFGSGSATATVADCIALGVGDHMILSRKDNTTVAAITAASTATVSVSSGMLNR